MRSKRYWEIDILRAVALGLMLVQHVYLVWGAVFVEKYLVNETVNAIGRVGAITFLLLVGVSGYLSFHFRKNKDASISIDNHFLKRGGLIFCYGLLLTFTSFIFIPTAPIYFGVLHFIGTAVTLLPIFIRFRWLSRVSIIIVPIVGAYLKTIQTDHLIWLVFGVYPRFFSALDHFPLFPWLAVVLLGVEVARFLYSTGERQFSLPVQFLAMLRPVVWVGQHTLLIYLLHVPVLFVIFWLAKFFLIGV